MKNIQRFALLGGPCPVCGSVMGLRINGPVDGISAWTVQWYCDQHSAIEGKPVTQPMCALVVQNITREDTIIIANAINGFYHSSQLPLVDAEIVCYDTQIGIRNAFLDLSELFDVPVADHLSSSAFDFASWFKVLVSKMDQEVIQVFRTMPSIQHASSASLFRDMREIFGDVLQVKGDEHHS